MADIVASTYGIINHLKNLGGQNNLVMANAIYRICGNSYISQAAKYCPTKSYMETFYTTTTGRTTLQCQVRHSDIYTASQLFPAEEVVVETIASGGATSISPSGTTPMSYEISYNKYYPTNTVNVNKVGFNLTGAVSLNSYAIYCTDEYADITVANNRRYSFVVNWNTRKIGNRSETLTVKDLNSNIAGSYTINYTVAPYESIRVNGLSSYMLANVEYTVYVGFCSPGHPHTFPPKCTLSYAYTCFLGNNVEYCDIITTSVKSSNSEPGKYSENLFTRTGTYMSTENGSDNYVNTRMYIKHDITTSFVKEHSWNPDYILPESWGPLQIKVDPGIYSGITINSYTIDSLFYINPTSIGIAPVSDDFIVNENGVLVTYINPVDAGGFGFEIPMSSPFEFVEYTDDRHLGERRRLEENNVIIKVKPKASALSFIESTTQTLTLRFRKYDNSIISTSIPLNVKYARTNNITFNIPTIGSEEMYITSENDDYNNSRISMFYNPEFRDKHNTFVDILFMKLEIKYDTFDGERTDIANFYYVNWRYFTSLNNTHIQIELPSKHHYGIRHEYVSGSPTSFNNDTFAFTHYVDDENHPHLSSITRYFNYTKLLKNVRYRILDANDNEVGENNFATIGIDGDPTSPYYFAINVNLNVCNDDGTNIDILIEPTYPNILYDTGN